MKELNPDLFEFSKYTGQVGYTSHDLFTDYEHKRLYLHEIQIEGFCDSSKLAVRPRNKGFTLMAWHKENQEYFWFHVEYYELVKIKLLDDDVYDESFSLDEDEQYDLIREILLNQ